MRDPEFDELLLFAHIKFRPGVYLGRKSLYALQNFLYGMDFAFSFAYKKNMMPYFSAFCRWYSNVHLIDQDSYANWYTHIVYTSACNDDLAFDHFYRYFELYLHTQHNLHLPDVQKGDPVYQSTNIGTF